MGIVVKLCVTCVRYTLLNIYFLLITIPLIILKVYNKRTMGTLLSQKRLDGKTVLITGGNAGIGYETAKELSYRGARILLASKNVGSAHLAKSKIIKETRNDDIAVYRLDLSSLWSTRNCAKEILKKENRLDVIIFNAGIGFIKQKMTEDNIQLSWQINCISSFLLCNLLVDLMKKTAPARIIFISSVMHHFHWFDSDNINANTFFSAFRNYCNTKFVTVLMANYIAKKLEGTGITVNTVNPGLVNVPLFRRVKNPTFQKVVNFILDNYGKPLEKGAATTLSTVLDPKLENVSGAYFSDCKESKCVSKATKDYKLAEKLWKSFERMVDLTDEERSELFL